MDMDMVWEKTKKGFKDGAAMSVEYTKIGKLKVDEMAVKGKIKRNYRDIGERYYDLVLDGREAAAAEDLAIRKYVDTIRALNSEIAEINAKIRDIKKGLDAPAADARAGDDESGV